MNNLFIPLALIVLIGGGVFAASNMMDDSSAPSSEMMEEMFTGEPLLYQNYSPEKFEMLKGKEKFALYFHADWCSKCKKLQKDIEKNPQKFAGANILKVNYDTAMDLKKQYGVNMQHTFIFFDEMGNVSAKATGPNKDEIMTFFQDRSGDSAMMKTEKMEMKEMKSKMMQVGHYEMFTQEKYNEYIGKNPIVLFFHADWCPTCRKQDSMIQQNISVLPEEVEILKVDYDTETDLKKKYKITMQSIVVVLDADGNEVGRVGDFSSIDPLKDLLMKAIMMSGEKDMMNEKEMDNMDDEKMMEKEGDNIELMYKDYSTENWNMFSGTRKFALYFYADWCPKCQQLENEISQNPDSFSGANILKVDYDNAIDLKKEYGITMQHTFVFFDENGNMVKKMAAPSSADIMEFFGGMMEKTVDTKEMNDPVKAMYATFTQEKYDAHLGKTPIAVFFYADWCPTCRKQDEVIQQNIDSLPSEVIILKADYDTQTQLKKQYGITMQSIIVVIDAQGREVGRVGDFSSVDPLKDLLVKAVNI